MNKKIIIVGAGISGLSAGCYAQANGYESIIFEMHRLPGGLCTAWERKGYTFDISMHMLTGSVSGPFHQMWRELGIPQKFKIFYHDHLARIEGKSNSIYFSAKREEFEQNLLQISRADADRIRELTSLIFGPDMMKAASLKPKATMNPIDSFRTIIAILPLIRIFTRYKNMTIQEFASGFKDPFLREAVRFLIDTPGWPMEQFPMVALAGYMRAGVTEAGAPLGGSQQVVYHMAELYRQRNGEIQYKKRVTDLIIEKNRVSGIILEDGSHHTADHVIWAGDGHTLLYDILKGKYLNQTITNMYENWIPVKPIVHVMMGVNRDFSGEPHQIIFEPETSIKIAGREYKWLCFLHHSFDPSMAPEGKSAVEVWYDTEYEYWEELARDKKAYSEEKKRIADYTIEQLNTRWPGFSNQVEVIDVPTPHTYKRYTGNWKGSPDGWYITPENMRVQEPVREVPGLEGISMIGQWTAPFTGTVIAALSGRQIIHLLCKKDGRKFKTAI